jgi:hypothetical protein
MREREPSTGRRADGDVTRDGDLSETAAHRLLGHEHRRTLLDGLAASDAPLSLTEAATSIAPEEDPDSRTVREIYLSLYHSHVPKLVDQGVVTLDRETNRVALTDRGRRLVDRQRAAESG